MPSKVFDSAKDALADVFEGATLMSGGFGLCGIAENCIGELVRRELRGLQLISNNIGNSGRGLAKLLVREQIAKAVCSYVGGNPDLEAQMLAGRIEVELVPQGTFAERIRAGGLGIPAFYTPAGADTILAAGREVRDFDRPCLLETALRADFAILKAERGDVYGNLWFKESARNFSPLMAMAADITIVEVEELLPLGALAPEDVHLPGIFVQRIFQGRDYRNDLEFRILEGESEAAPSSGARGWSFPEMAERVVRRLQPGGSLNLGIGLPTRIAEHIPPELGIMVHSENGVLGIQGRPSATELSPTLINAGKESVRIGAGASFFDSALSFGMIRGGHIDVCVLGGMQVDLEGSLANWMIPGRKVTGMGGAMDLVHGAGELIVLMQHFDRQGRPKLVERCSLPLTGKGVVDLVVTELGVFRPRGTHFEVLELAAGVALDEVALPGVMGG